MSQKITAKIFRFDPDRDVFPYYKTYDLESEVPLTALFVLKEIHEKIDPTLAYRTHMCRHGVCGSCFIRVNGRDVRGCNTLIRPNEEITIEPLSGHRVIRDLVVHFPTK